MTYLLNIAGHSATLMDIVDEVPSSSGETGFSYDVSHLHHGATLFAKVKCENGVGLHQHLVSKHVTMVTSPPDVSGASINVVTFSETQFPPADLYQSSNSTVYFGWNGIHDDVGISTFKASPSLC